MARTLSTDLPAQVETFLDSVPHRSVTLVIDGPAGIGKSYVWNGVVDEALRRDWLVLSARPSQAETRLVGSALIDLLSTVDDGTLHRLPEPQYAALSAALLRTTPSETEADPHAIAVSVSTLVRQLAGEHLLLIAVDDVQWLDPETAAVVAFVVRRMPAERVGVALCHRTEPGSRAPDLIAEIGGAGLRCPVAPMDADAIERVLTQHLASRVPGPVLRRAVEVSGGNPLYAIEVAKALVNAGGSASYDQVRLPPTLTEVIGQHLRALPESARLALAAAAALTRPTVAHLRPLGLDTALVSAERAGLAHVAGVEVRFEHPLFAAVAYDDLVGSERTLLHTRLAAVVDGPEERARHLAMGADGPDPDVAAVLDDACQRALARGALHAAVDACRLALRATPEGDPGEAARRLTLGHLLFRAGEPDRARRELEAVAFGEANPHSRSRALCELARIAIENEPGPRAAELAYAALDLADTDELAADIHVILTLARNDDIDAGVRHAREAIALLDRSADPNPGKVASALAALAETSFRAGDGLDHEACERAMLLEAKTVPPPVMNRAIMTYAFLLMYADELDHARELFLRAHQLALDEGDHGSLPEAVGHLSLLELWAGHWDVAERHARDGLRYSERAGEELSVLTARCDLAWIHAHRGRSHDARAVADELVAVGVGSGDVSTEAWGRALLGFCAVAEGDAARAVTELSRHAALRSGTKSREPGFYWIAPWYVEALVTAGDLDLAGTVLDSYQAEARAVGRRSALAGAARARALLSAARGEFADAVLAAEEAVQGYAELGRPFDRANAWLAKGQVHRRWKQKALAKQALSTAMSEFERLGASSFADRARAELSRVGLRPPAPLHLTETEHRIAELTAQGMTTKEVAAALFLSPRTVAANLTRIYRKLGVRNRAELSASMQTRVT
jgi:DNA-binding CsgD family transcriptional regulator